MNIAKVTNRIVEALGSTEPIEVRVHQVYPEVLKVLIVSRYFKDVKLSDRISLCVGLLNGANIVSAEDGLPYLFIVEPVTPEQFKERSMPWPE